MPPDAQWKCCLFNCVLFESLGALPLGTSWKGVQEKFKLPSEILKACEVPHPNLTLQDLKKRITWQQPTGSQSHTFRNCITLSCSSFPSHIFIAISLVLVTFPKQTFFTLQQVPDLHLGSVLEVCPGVQTSISRSRTIALMWKRMAQWTALVQKHQCSCS